MIRDISTILALYGPLTLFALLFLAMFLLKKQSKRANIALNLFGIFSYKLPIRNITRLRIVFFLSALMALSIYLFMDFTGYFPDNFTMEVYFRESDIKEGLKAFTDDELANLGVPLNYEQYQHVYYESLDTALAKILNIPKFFTQQRAILHSEGTTTFLVEKERGIQNYYIKESKGTLIHFLERPGQENITFRSIFEKANSNNDNIRPSLVDMYYRRSVILKPMFKQIIAENFKSDRVIFNHTLYGVTKITLFPYPSFNSTIYLFEMEKIGLIPIAVAVYQ